MHKFRSWTLDPPEYRTQRNRLLPIEGGDGSTLNLDFTTGVLDPRLTFTRASGGTYVANDGYIYGMDFATSSSLAIGTGPKSVTLTATAGVDRRYLVGQTVWISNGANNMRGPVTAYDASTQVLTIDATNMTGSGSFTSWTVGNASARFDHDPTTGSPRGLLIEGSATNLLQQSADWTVSPWSKPAQITWDGTTYATAPDGTNTAKQVTVTVGTSASVAQGIANATNRTVSLWLRAGSLTTFSVGAFDSTGGTTWGNNADSTCRIISGPGSVSQQVGGLWSVTGLSTTQWTRVEVFRSSSYGALLVYPGGTGTVTGTAFMWGMQMEAGNGASSLIPTGASQGTRARDECSITGNSFSSWFTNPNEGSFFVQYSMNYPSASMGAGIDRYAFEISDSVGSSRALCIAAYRNAPAGRNVRVFNPSGASFDSGDTLTTSSALNTKFAFGYATANNYIAAVGVAQAFQTYNTGSLPTSPAINQMWLGTNRNLSSTTYLFGCIRTIKYWPTRLPNATLQGLVS